MGFNPKSGASPEDFWISIIASLGLPTESLCSGIISVSSP